MTDDIESNNIPLFKFKNNQGKKNKVLFTDIDDTYFCKASKYLHKAQKAALELTQFLKEHSIPTIAVTARHLEGVINGQKSKIENLPQFDAIAACLGTEIWVRHEDQYIQDNDYKEYIIEQTGFRRSKIHTLCKSFIPLFNSKYNYLNMKFQIQDKYAAPFESPEKVRPFKLALHFNGTLEDGTKIRTQFKSLLKQSGFEKIHVLDSIDSKLKNGLYKYNLDISAATKHTAVSYMQKKYNLKGIVAGDSRNDIQMILNSGTAAIVVGHCKKDLLEEIKKRTIKRHKYLASMMLEDHTERVIYVEPSDSERVGPESVLRALKLFKDCNFLSSSVNLFNWKAISALSLVKNN